MIINTRVDHRLLHGQVSFSWTQNLGINAILIANDDVMNNEVLKSSMKIAKPQGVKLVVKSVDGAIDAIKSGVTDKYRLFIILKTIEDAYKLINACPEIKHLNVGGTNPTKDTESIAKTVFVTENDKKLLNELIDNGVDIYTQMIPTNKKEDIKLLLKEEE